MPPVDRDESRFAQASRQMAQSGDYVVPRVLGKPRLNKPPLIYWLQSSSALVLSGGDISRDAIWMYRIPSLLAAIIAVLLTWRLGCALFDPRGALLGAALFAIGPMVFWEAHQARADMLMVACTTGAVLLLWRVLRPGHRRNRWGVLVALGMVTGVGVLAKGPMTPLVVGLAAAAWAWLHRGRVRERAGPGAWAGVAVVAVIAAAMIVPWVVMVARHVGFERYADIVRDEVLGRSVSAKEGHSGPPGYHAMLAMVLLFPASLWLGAGVWRGVVVGLASTPGVGGWVSRLAGRLRTLRGARPQECFLLCVFFPAWVVMEVVSTKLPHYTMPLYPALGLLCARAALSGMPRMHAWLRAKWVAIGIRVWRLIGVGLAIGAAWLGWILARDGVMWGWVVLAIGAGAGLQFLFESAGVIRERDYRELLRRAMIVGAVSLMLVGFSLPRVRAMWVVSRLVDEARRIDPGDEHPLAFVRLHEDSAIFRTRGHATWVNAEDAPAWAVLHPEGLVVVSPEDAEMFGAFEELGRVEGFNYSKGKKGVWLIGRATP